MTGGASSSVEGFVAFRLRHGARVLAGVVFERPIPAALPPLGPPTTGAAALP